MRFAYRLILVVLSAAAPLVLHRPAIGGEIAVGDTGLLLPAPDAFVRLEAPAGGLLLDLGEKGGKRRIGVLELDAKATGQVMAEKFDLLIRRRHPGLRLTAEERVRVNGAGAMCRVYSGAEGADRIEAEAVIFVRGEHRLVLFTSGPAGTVKELRAVLLALRPGSAQASGEARGEIPDGPRPAPNPDPPVSDPPPKKDPPTPEGTAPKPPPAPKPLKLPGTRSSITPPAGWRGGPHAPTKGLRIVDPNRACIIDVSAVKPGEKERGDAAVESAAADFEKQLLNEPARWRRVENRRERIDGRSARVRRYEGAPGGLPCDFVVLVTLQGNSIILARSIYPKAHRERFREAVLASLRSIELR